MWLHALQAKDHKIGAFEDLKKTVSDIAMPSHDQGELRHADVVLAAITVVNTSNPSLL